MARAPNTYGGGAQTNLNGLAYERDTDLLNLISNIEGFTIEDNIVYKNGRLVASYFSKHCLYKNFLKPKGIEYKNYISSKLLPDDAFIIGDTCYIIEKKYQSAAGSVDEKLQTFQFKKKQYEKMFSVLNMRVEFYYLINDWFKDKKYRDILLYIESNGCRYFFVPNELIASLNIY